MSSTTSSVMACRLGAIICGVAYFPLGLVWAYGMALLALPLAAAGFLLLRIADRRETHAGLTRTRAQQRWRTIGFGVLLAGLMASVGSLIVTR